MAEKVGVTKQADLSKSSDAAVDAVAAEDGGSSSSSVSDEEGAMYLVNLKKKIDAHEEDIDYLIRAVGVDEGRPGPLRAEDSITTRLNDAHYQLEALRQLLNVEWIPKEMCLVKK